MVSFVAGATAAGSLLSGIGSIAGAFGGSKGTSRKRELDSYRLQAQSQREAIGPLREAYEAAGYHPLLAVGQQPFQPGGAVVGDNGPTVGERLQAMGQGAQRLASVGQDAEQRIFTREFNRLQLDKLKSENDLLKAQTTRIMQPTTPPVGGNYSVPGQSGSGIVSMLPSDQIHSFPGQPNRQAGTINTFQVGTDGSVVPSEQMKERIDDDFIGSILWHLRNRIGREDLPDGRVWSNFNQQYMHPDDYKRTGWSRFRRFLTHH